MPSNEIIVRHLFGGGWATDFGPNSDAVPNEAGQLVIPFLVDADNTVLELDGAPRKAPGTSRINSTELESGAVVTGLFDVWFQGSSGTPTHQRVAHVGTKIKKDDADGSFSDIFTGLQAGAVPSYSMLSDILVIASDASADVPKSWDGTTAQNLAGSPPNFSFSVEHKGRIWSAGVASTPSALHYTALDDPEDSVGAGSGTISISPNDGDQITGVASHRDELWVFKGPYKGSIHRITGSSPTGSDAFARKTFVTGLGAAWHNLIFPFRDDLGFVWSDGTIHSLKAVEAFGDFRQVSLSRAINGWVRAHVNRARLRQGWAQDISDEERVLITVPIDTSSTHNMILSLDYRFEPPRITPWPGFADVAGSLAIAVDETSNDRRLIIAGGNDGFVRKLGQSNRSIDDTTAINYKVTTPFFTYSNPVQMKTLAAVGLAFQPKNNGSVVFGWTRDNEAQDTVSIEQGGSDVLGPASSNQFTLGTSQLGGARFVDQFSRLNEEGAEFRAVQYQITNSVLNEDVEIHAITAKGKGGAESLET